MTIAIDTMIIETTAGTDAMIVEIIDTTAGMTVEMTAGTIDAIDATMTTGVKI